MSSVVVRFTVPGEPRSKERPRHGKGGRTYTPKTTADAEAKVAWWFKNAAPDWLVDEENPFGVFARFVAGTRRRRDSDNMIKLVLDALNHVTWRDDFQVKEIVALIGYEKGNARTEVTIYKLGEQWQSTANTAA